MQKPSEWCLEMYDKTFDQTYLKLYEMWKERENGKVPSASLVSES